MNKMKFFGSLGLIASSALVLNATTYTWNTESTAADSYWSTEGNWTVDGQATTAIPGSNGEGTVENPYDTVVITSATSSVNINENSSNFNLENLTITSSTLSHGWGEDWLTVQDTITLDTATITSNTGKNFHLTTNDLKMTTSNVKNVLLTVNNTLTLVSGTSTLQALDEGSYINNISFGGNLTLSVYASSIFETGGINSEYSNSVLNIWNTTSSNITISGTGGVYKGMLVGGITTEDLRSTITITDGADQSFIGDNANAAGYTYYSASYIIFTVDTDSKLTLSTSPYVDVNLNGGKFQAYNSGVELSVLKIQADKSSIQFDLTDITVGTAYLDVASFTTESSDFEVYIDLENIDILVDGYEYILISADSTDLSADDFVLRELVGDDWTVYEGDWGISLDGDNFILSQTAVPEPSTYALVFGALALGLAYYRKRK